MQRFANAREFPGRNTSFAKTNLFNSIVLIAIVLGLLALAAGLMYRARRQRLLNSARLSDDMVRQIEEAGYVDVDEPLDLEEIHEEEARFWEEQPWEEPEEF